MGTQNGTAPLEDSSAVSYKTKYILTIRVSNYTSCYSLKRVENMFTQKHIHVFIAALFLIAKTGQQPAYPPGGE